MQDRAQAQTISTTIKRKMLKNQKRVNLALSESHDNNKGK